jgi:hypothetical protein
VDTFALVGQQIEAGQKLLERLHGTGIPVTAAAWVKPTEKAQWYLYLVTPLVGENRGVKPAYRQISPVVRELQDEGNWIEVFDVKVAGPTEATGEAIAKLSRETSVNRPTRYSGAYLGDLSIDGAYIYPAVPAPATS